MHCCLASMSSSIFSMCILPLKRLDRLTSLANKTTIMINVLPLYLRGDSQIMQRDGIMATLWKDNRVVTVLSSNSQPNEEDVVQRWQRDGSKVDVRCPAALAKYQQFMGGVDRNGQLRQYYMVPTKCHKFYKYIFWFLFEASITNSYILHSNYSSGPKQSLKEYRLELAKGLVGDFHSKKRHNRHPAPPTNLTLLQTLDAKPIQ